MKHLTKRVYLVSCTQLKHDTPMAAQDLYMKSVLFQHCRRFVSGKKWFILSAKYGVISPDSIIAPYDKAVMDFTRQEKEAWSFRITNQLKFLCPYGTEIISLCGNSYTGPKELDALRGAGLSVLLPMDKLSIGKRLQWLKAEIEKNAST